MLEIEQKYAAADFADLERRLAASGATLGPAHDEADHYFNAPDRDFRLTDEAFRLRRVGPSNALTYKGPKQQSTVKVRTELETALRDGDQSASEMTQLLVHLGYRATAVVRKRRRSASLKRDGLEVTVCLDDVERVGRFAELEVLAPEGRREAAERVLTALAADLGLTTVERRSYLAMVLQATGVEPPEAGP
jgi:adenylate cyclase class 2